MHAALPLAIAVGCVAAAERIEPLIEGQGLHEPFAAARVADGSLYIADFGHRIWRWDGKALAAVAGTGEAGMGAVPAPAVGVQLNAPHSLVALPAGDLLVADSFNHRVLRLDPARGLLEPFAGTGEKGLAGDGGPALAARFSQAYALALSPDAARLAIVDLGNKRVRVVDIARGGIATLAGGGSAAADGAVATDAGLKGPRAAAIGLDGTVWIAERDGHRLLAMAPDGRLRVAVGDGRKGHAGDGGDGRAAQLNGPKDVCVDRDGSVLIADAENHVIRRYIPATGRIVRVAGTGKPGKGRPGDPLACELNRPHGVSIDRDGAIVICDSLNARVLAIRR